MLRRNWRLLLLLVLLVVVTVDALDLWPQTASRITQENFDRIREGMSLDEVSSILGPPGDYRTGPVVYDGDLRVRFGDTDNSSGPMWQADEAAINVYYAPPPHSHLVLKRFFVGRKYPQSRLSNLVWLVKRQWQRWTYIP